MTTLSTRAPSILVYEDLTKTLKINTNVNKYTSTLECMSNKEYEYLLKEPEPQLHFIVTCIFEFDVKDFLHIDDLLNASIENSISKKYKEAINSGNIDALHVEMDFSEIEKRAFLMYTLISK